MRSKSLHKHSCSLRYIYEGDRFMQSYAIPSYAGFNNTINGCNIQPSKQDHQLFTVTEVICMYVICINESRRSHPSVVCTRVALQSHVALVSLYYLCSRINNFEGTMWLGDFFVSFNLFHASADTSANPTFYRDIL